VSCKILLAGCFVTVLVSGAMAATEPATTPAQVGVPPQTSAQPAASTPANAPAAPAAQTPPQTSKETPAGHPPADQAAKPDAKKAPSAPVKKVDLNNASLAELKTLPMVSDEYAKKIIAHRPYMSKGELVTKAGLPEGVYIAVRRKVMLQAPKKSAPKQPVPKL